MPTYTRRTTRTVNDIRSITYTFGVPHKASLPIQKRLKRPCFSWDCDHLPIDGLFDGVHPFWKTVDTQFHRLENLYALRIDLEPEWPLCGHEKLWVERTVALLPLLRTRENFRLSFTVDREVVPWDHPPRPLPFELHLEVLRHLISAETRDTTRVLET